MSARLSRLSARLPLAVLLALATLAALPASQASAAAPVPTSASLPWAAVAFAGVHRDAQGHVDAAVVGVLAVVVQPKNRVNGKTDPAVLATLKSASLAALSELGKACVYDGLASGAPVYVNGDPVNLVDPTGHRPTTGCEDGGCGASRPVAAPTHANYHCSGWDLGCYGRETAANLMQVQMSFGLGMVDFSQGIYNWGTDQVVSAGDQVAAVTHGDWGGLVKLQQAGQRRDAASALGMVKSAVAAAGFLANPGGAVAGSIQKNGFWETAQSGSHMAGYAALPTMLAVGLEGVGGGAAGAAAQGDLAASQGQLLSGLRQVARSKAGFAADGEPLIVDNAMGVNPNSIASGLRGQGYNARSVTEIFGPDPGDASIGGLADTINGRIFSADEGGGAFGARRIPVDMRIRTVDSIVRLLLEGAG